MPAALMRGLTFGFGPFRSSAGPSLEPEFTIVLSLKPETTRASSQRMPVHDSDSSLNRSLSNQYLPGAPHNFNSLRAPRYSSAWSYCRLAPFIMLLELYQPPPSKLDTYYILGEIA